MLQSLSHKILIKRQAELRVRLSSLKQLGYQLNMARGLPSPEQLDLANSLLTLPGIGQYKNTDELDCRNYGGHDGLPEIKTLFGEILDCPKEHIIVGNNSSLSMMHDALMRAYVWGVS